MSDAALARAIAEEAGALLMDLRRAGGASGRELGDLGDARANALILDRLATARSDDAILSEESSDDRARCEVERVWIVDPLDGTREYTEGRDDWAVHVALCVGGVAVAGAVALPALDLVFDSAVPATPAPRNAPPIIVVSRSRPPVEAAQAADALGATTLTMGSAGAKAMAVVRGVADCYVHAGGQYEWDSCAPVAVALANGLHASRLDGTPLRYNRPDPYLPDLLICRPELADAALAALASA